MKNEMGDDILFRSFCLRRKSGFDWLRMRMSAGSRDLDPTSMHVRGSHVFEYNVYEERTRIHPNGKAVYKMRFQYDASCLEALTLTGSHTRGS